MAASAVRGAAGCDSLGGCGSTSIRLPEPTLGVEWEFALVDKTSPRPEQHGVRPVRRAKPGWTTRRGCTRSCCATPSRSSPASATPSARRSPTCATRSRPSCRWPTSSASTCTAGARTRSPRGRAQQLTEGHRYEELINRTQWWGRQMLIWGVHVHVGMPEQERVMPVLSALLNHLPPPARAVRLVPDLGRHRHRLRLQPGADVPAAADRRAAVPVRAVVGVRGVRRRPDVTGVIEDCPRSAGTSARPRTSAPSRTGSATACRLRRDLAALVALMHCLVVDLDTRLAPARSCRRCRRGTCRRTSGGPPATALDAIVILDADNRERLVTDDLADLLERLAPWPTGWAAPTSWPWSPTSRRAGRRTSAAGRRRAHRRRPRRRRRLRRPELRDGLGQ